MIGREIAILRAEIPLKLNRIARSQRHHRLQPEGRGFRDMRAADLAVGPSDFGRAVQHETTAHPGRCAGIDLVEQRCAEQVCPVHRCGVQAGPSIEGPLVIVVGVVQAYLRPSPDADIVVIVGVGLEARQLRLIDDAVRVVDAQPVEEGAAVGGDRHPEPVGPKEPDQRLRHEIGLEREPEIVARRFLVHGVEQIAGPAFGHGLGCSGYLVRLGT